MISFLSGKIKLKADDFIILDVQGIGYKIFVPFPILEKLGKEGSRVELYTYLNLTEEGLELYGFQTLEEEKFFKDLLAVAGVGPKAAIKILGIAPLLEIKQAIASGDLPFLENIPGIGKKKAQRLILELKGKMVSELGGKVPKIFKKTIPKETIEALTKLGYKVSEVKKVIQDLPKEIKEVSEQVRWALKNLGKK